MIKRVVVAKEDWAEFTHRDHVLRRHIDEFYDFGIWCKVYSCDGETLGSQDIEKARCRLVDLPKELRDQYELQQSSGLQPISTAPKDGRYILLFGPSGCATTPLRCQVCHWDSVYRPLNPWQTYSDDAFSDSGDPPTHWMPLP